MRILLLTLILVLPLSARAESDYPIQTLEGPYAKETWLLEQHNLPIITLRIAFKRGGGASDPVDKPGLAILLSDVIARGAGDLDNLHFKQWLEDLAIDLDFSVDKDYFYVSMKTLSDNRDVAFKLAALALSKPRFDEKELADAHDQALTRLVQEQENPDYIANLAWNQTVYGKHPYAHALLGTKESIPALSRADLENFRTTYLTRADMHVSVVGDISRAQLETLLNKYFLEIPATPAHEQVTVPDFTDFPKGQIVHIERPLPQSIATFGERGIPYHDPDYYPASVLNYVLGGGEFQSRLMQEIRVKRGLAYSVYTYLLTLAHTANFRGEVGTRTDAMATSLDLVKQGMQRLRDTGITQDELTDAKHHLTGSFALSLDSISKLAGMLTMMQMQELGLDFLDKRNAMVENVTLDQVNASAKRLLAPENLLMVVVGKTPDKKQKTEDK